MVLCERCNDKGYREEQALFGEKVITVVKQCCDIRSYSNEVRRRFNQETLKDFVDEQLFANVLPFKRENENV